MFPRRRAKNKSKVSESEQVQIDEEVAMVSVDLADEVETPEEVLEFVASGAVMEEVEVASE
jgi:hypothetical protein